MIVKDEAHVIKDTLATVLRVFPITYWVIDDTGSTDGTQDIIRAFFAERGISGELYETPWRNFGFNRTEALRHAYGKTDYVLVWDADDSVVGNVPLPAQLTADSYLLQFGGDTGFRYQRSQIFNNRKRWRYVGVLHEYPACMEAATDGVPVRGDYYCVSGKTGARSRDPDKYRKDAAVLEQGLIDEPGNDRYVFYCGNSYKDAGDPDNAIRMYKRLLTMNGWSEEKYLACVRIYDLSACPANLHYLVESHRHCAERVEGIRRLVQHYVHAGMNDVALAYYGLVQGFYETRYTGDDIAKHLFVEKADFDFYLPYHTIIAAIRLSRFELAATLYVRVFQFKYTAAGAWWNNCLFHNLLSVAPHIRPDLTFLDNMLAFRAALPYKLDDVPNKAIAAVIDRHRELLGGAVVPSPHVGRKGVTGAKRVMLTITSCKRLDLFQKTVNSMLRTWTDLDAVDSFMCVDDNSSEADRAIMRSEYPFFEFYMKTPAERGHRQSMNIIWERLRAVRPAFWIHLEDDWLFFRRGSYVRDPIAFLEEKRDIHQLLYNRNYAELYGTGWNINGGLSLGSGFLLHQKDVPVTGANCAYWPHYSFRPSVVRVAPILELGNYDSPNVFFERDYADKWFAAGYRSAFFDDIRCLHIGRLTSDKTGDNAYTLNGVGQFSAPASETLPCRQSRQVRETAPPASETLPCRVVNLARRPDRREAVRAVFSTIGWSDTSGDYCFYEAVDGAVLSPAPEIAHLFSGNDFGNRRGFIGCALSHYRIWQKLAASVLPDSIEIVFEDDIRVADTSTFRARLTEAESRIHTQNLDILFLGHTCWNNDVRSLHASGGFTTMNWNDFVGGTFGYIISVNGAKKLVDYITKHGIRHGIDYIMKITPNIRCDVAAPHMILSEWARPGNRVDSDIQNCAGALDMSDAGEWIFYAGKDHFGSDVKAVGRKPVTDLVSIASDITGCNSFNTLGFMKNAGRFTLFSPHCYGSRDGLFVRKPRIQLLGFWGDPDSLRAEFLEQCTATSRAVKLVGSKETPDYYVVLGKPWPNSMYDPSHTLTFHLEPWCGEAWQTWGVKTWGAWAAPDPSSFLYVQTAAMAPTPGFWQLTRTPVEPVSVPKLDQIRCILSAKAVDPGQRHRVDFLRYLETEHPDLPVAVYGRENYHGFVSYKGKVSESKEAILLPAKYYFMCENNAEYNYVTEKLWEPILCESLCFYWGAPNITDIVDSGAYICLDMTDYPAAARVIRQAIATDEWARRLPAIRAAKRKLLSEQALFVQIERELRRRGIIP